MHGINLLANNKAWSTLIGGDGKTATVSSLQSGLDVWNPPNPWGIRSTLIKKVPFKSLKSGLKSLMSSTILINTC